MDVFDVLSLAAELAMALAGFAGIIAAFQYQDNVRIRRADATGLTIIVIYSLTVAFQCGLLLILHVLAVEERTIWVIGSFAAAGFCTYHLYSFFRNIKGAVRNGRLLIIMWVLQLISVVIFLANLLNATGTVFDREPGPILINLAFGMSLAGYMFSRLLLVPIWRTVHKQEAIIDRDESQPGKTQFS